ncbi:mucin TcMUCII [Trypanosoma cruzi]|nr:mucin TcMUCII [Trypanosoma cruzi]
MTTCRLLCALLVLALCCCPSVCAATSEGEAGEPDPKDGEKGGPGQEMDSLPKTLQPQTKEEGDGSEKQKPNTPNHTPQETATVTGTAKSESNSNKVQEQEDGHSNKEEADIDKTIALR